MNTAYWLSYWLGHLLGEPEVAIVCDFDLVVIPEYKIDEYNLRMLSLNSRLHI